MEETTELRGHNRFLLVSYTDLLKEYAVAALNACGIPITLEDILCDKERYRPFLIELGTVLGFDEGFGIREKVMPQIIDQENVVFDNVRFPRQMDILETLGFRLIRLVTSEEIRHRRAQERGMDDLAFYELLTNYSEWPLPPREGEIKIANDGPIDRVIDDLYQKLARLAA